MKPTYRYRPKQPQLPKSQHYLAYYLCNTLFGFPIVLYRLFRQMALPMVREDMLKLILFLILPFGWLLTIPVGLLLGLPWRIWPTGCGSQAIKLE